MSLPTVRLPKRVYQRMPKCLPLTKQYPLYALGFGGTIADYVSLPNLGIAGGAFTITAWVNPQSTGTYRTIMGYDGTHRLLISNGGDLYVQFDGNYVYWGAVPNNVWTFVIYIFDGANEYLGVNGSLRSPHATILPVWNVAFYLGQYDLVNYPYKGFIALPCTYDRALSLAEIHRNMRNPMNPLRTGLVLWLPMIEGQGVNVADYSGLGNNGTLGGVTWKELQKYEIPAAAGL